MNPNDPTQPKPVQTLPQLRQSQPMSPPMPSPQSNANPTPAVPLGQMPPPIAQPQSNFVPPLPQRAPQPQSNAQTGARSMFSGIGGPAGSRPAPNAPMKPMPAPTGGRPNMQARRTTPMGG